MVSFNLRVRAFCDGLPPDKMAALCCLHMEFKILRFSDRRPYPAYGLGSLGFTGLWIEGFRLMPCPNAEEAHLNPKLKTLGMGAVEVFLAPLQHGDLDCHLRIYRL